jgi:PAS domain S-box-containing protein
VNQLGYSEAEELNRSPDQIFALIHPQDRDAVLCGIERAIASKQSDLLYAYRIQHRLGHTIWREDHARFQYDGCGNYAGACVVARDITERMHAKADLLETNRVLIQTRLQLRELLAQNEATLENEKRHIAREVHDELGQVLTALRMDLALAVIRHAAQAPDLLDELNGMKNQVDRAIQGVRSVANSLRPAALDMGLVTAIEWLCMEFTKYGDVECGLHGFDESFEIDDSRAVVIFRIVQEALTNIRKYAQACEVKVTLEMRGPELGVEVRDNGLGFDLAAVAQRGTLGLLGMRERVIALGGRIEVHSTPGQGTTISVVIPLEPKVANVAKGPA